MVNTVNGPGPGVYFYQALKLDKRHDEYKRNVFSFMGVIAMVEGIYNAIFFWSWNLHYLPLLHFLLLSDQ